MFLKTVLHSFGYSSQRERTFGRTWLLLEYHLFNGQFVLTFESSDTEYSASSIVILPVFCPRFSDFLTRFSFCQILLLVYYERQYKQSCR